MGESSNGSQPKKSEPVSTVSIDPGLAGDMKSRHGDALLDSHSRVTITLPDQHVTLPLSLNELTFIGRQEAGSSYLLDLDLSPYDAHAQGVSRVHAVIRLAHSVLMITDLDSRNGTYLNGERLPAHQPRILRDGDEIRLGNLLLQLHFGDQPPSSTHKT
jgi:pSer/pThr/pTyr-binding forkhead associated (FHA) protein